MLHEIRDALRSLRQGPALTAISVVCLALGIGANTAIFSLLDAAVLRRLPVAEPERLITVEMRDAAGRGGSSFSFPMFRYLREQATGAADVFAYGRIDVNLDTGALTDSPVGLAVSENYFAALGVQPSIGRSWRAPDEPAVVLGYRYWRARFDGTAAVLGRTLTLNGVPVTVVGVGPRGFFGTEVGRYPDLYVPLTLRDRLTPDGPRLAQANSFWLRVMGRLTGGTSPAQAAARLQAAYEAEVGALGGRVSAGLLRFLQQRRIAVAPGERGPLGTAAAPGTRGLSGLGDQFGVPLRILMAASGAVLLIACANVAGLLLVRGIARRREIAIRLALGAARARLVRQWLIESALLSAAGGGLGLLAGVWSADALASLPADGVLEVPLDMRMLAFTSVASIGTALLFGVAPALRATGGDLTPSLRSGLPAVRRGRPPGRLVLPVQVALSLLLLVGAGLFIRTLSNLRTMDAGFQGDRVTIATVNPGLSRYPPERVRAFYAGLLERAAALPGVEAAAIADTPLLAGTYIDGFSIEGTTSGGETSLKMVSPRFFDTMGIRLLAGRDFSAADDARAPRVAIVNETIVRLYFGGRSPLGTRIDVNGQPNTEIVGVIADTKYRGLREPIPNTIYLPLEQVRALGAERTLHVRAAPDAGRIGAAVRDQVKALDSTLPARVRPFADLVDANLERERLIAMLCGVFSGLALLLTAIGLYGVIAHGVQRRTREIGIRMSLGARRTGVMWMVLRDCVTVAAAGIAAGAPLSVWLSRGVRAQLFGVSPYDPLTAACAAATLLVVAAAAGYLPARRASRVDPAVALRQD